MCSSASFQLKNKNLFHFSTCETSAVTDVIVDSFALNQDKLLNQNNIREHIQYQLEALSVFCYIKNLSNTIQYNTSKRSYNNSPICMIQYYCERVFLFIKPGGLTDPIRNNDLLTDPIKEQWRKYSV